MAKPTFSKPIYQDAQTGELVVQWDWPHTGVEQIKIQWWYHTPDSLRLGGAPFLHSENTLSADVRTCRTTIPENAYSVWFYVMMISSEGAGWTAEWSDDSPLVYWENADVPAPVSAGSPTNVRVFLNDGGALVGTWYWNKEHTSGYTVRWWYHTSATIRNGTSAFCAESDVDDVTVDTTAKLSRFSIPEGAQRIRFQVKPLAETHTVNGVEVEWWTANWSDLYAEQAVYYPEANPEPPKAPGVPTVSVDGYKLSMELRNLDTAGQIYFQVARNNTVVKNQPVDVRYGEAAYTMTMLAGSRYKVRARVYQRDIMLYSDWSDWSADCTSAPSVPGGITVCQAASETSVRLQWSGSSNAESYDLEYATQKAYLGASDAASTISGIVGTTYIKTGLDTGQRYYFRVRAVNKNGVSGWTAARSTVLGTAPAAPTTWSSTTTAVAGESVTLYWSHNCEDGSSQTGAELRLTVNGVSNTVTFGDGAASGIYTLDTSKYTADTTVRWSVRTKGITGVFGPWSAYRAVEIYAPPVLELTLADGTGLPMEKLTSFPLYVKAAAGPASQKPIGYQVTVAAEQAYETTDAVGRKRYIKRGDAVFDEFVDTRQRLNLTLSPGNIDLENSVSYRVTVEATMDSGLTASDTASFTVAWKETAYKPDVEIGVNRETLEAYIRPYVDHEESWLTDSKGGNILDSKGGKILTDSFANGLTLGVYRREYDGSFTEIITGLTNGRRAYVTDPHPALDYARYRIVAVDKRTGAVSFYDPPGYPVQEKSIVLQWDEQWSTFGGDDDDDSARLAEPPWSGSMLKLPYNVDVSDSSAPDVSLAEYIGRKDPVSYYGTQQGKTATWRVDISKYDKETLYALRRLAAWMGDVYAREPSGSGYWANATVSFEQKHLELVIPVTIQLTRVEGGV